MNNNNNNNNNRIPLMQVRDRLFQAMFLRVAVAYANIFPEKARNAMEKFLLFFALLCLFSLTYIHVMFVHTPMNCLDSFQNDWPRNGILRIEVIRNSSENRYTLEESYKKEERIRHFQAYNNLFLESEDFPSKSLQQKIISEDSELNRAFSPFSNKPDPVRNSGKVPEETVPDSFGTSSEALTEPLNISEIETDEREDGSPTNSTYDMPLNWTVSSSEDPVVISPDCPIDAYIVEYSLEYGFLKMSEKARTQLKIPVKMVVLDASTDKCFGNWFTRLLLDNIIGYNDVILASVSKLAAKEESKGYIRNVVTEHYFRFVNVMGHSSYVFAAVIMLVFTFSISTLLRYSHQQIFLFIVQLLRLFEFRAPAAVQTAPLLTVILSLVGMEAIMSEFFSDPTTSFYVILIVWMADQYDAICCRTPVSRRHWLRFFYLYHFAFYAYEYRFSGQYSGMALFTSCCFVFHSMIYFFHHYELPQILRSAHLRNRHRQPQQQQPRTQSPPRDPDAEASAEAPADESSSSPDANAGGIQPDASDSGSDASSTSSQNQEEYTPDSTDGGSSSSSSSSTSHGDDGDEPEERDFASSRRHHRSFPEVHPAPFLRGCLAPGARPVIRKNHRLAYSCLVFPRNSLLGDGSLQRKDLCSSRQEMLANLFAHSNDQRAVSRASSLGTSSLLPHPVRDIGSARSATCPGVSTVPFTNAVSRREVCGVPSVNRVAHPSWTPFLVTLPTRSTNTSHWR